MSSQIDNIIHELCGQCGNSLLTNQSGRPAAGVDTWLEENLSNRLDLVEHHKARRFHEVFTQVAELVQSDTLTVQDKMALMLNVIRPDMEYHNLSNTLQTVVDISLECEDPLSSLAFVNQWNKLGAGASADCKILLRSTMAWHLLKLGRVDLAESLAEELSSSVEHGFGLKPSTEAAYYRVLCYLNYSREDYTKVYKYGMFYFKNVGEADENVRRGEKAYKSDKEMFELLCKASLLSEQVYSFSDLLQLPAIKYLNTQEESNVWRDLVVICNSGDFSMLELYLQQNPQHSQLVQQYIESIQAKLRSFALLEAAFKKPADERVLTFQEVAQVCKIGTSDVEKQVLQLMKRNLLKGSIDAIENIVTFSYLQPRILDQAKIWAMAEQYSHWTKQMRMVHEQLITVAPDLLTKANSVLLE